MARYRRNSEDLYELVAERVASNVEALNYLIGDLRSQIQDHVEKRHAILDAFREGNWEILVEEGVISQAVADEVHRARR